MSASAFTQWIDGPSGRLFAIVHAPDANLNNGAVILMPSAGQDSRVGPQRIYLKAARRFVAEGFTTIRLDLSGTGDSATPNPAIHLDSHSTDDVKAGIEWIRQNLHPEKTFLVALCAGARVAIRYAAEDANIDGLVAWSVPTLSEGDSPYLNSEGVKNAVKSRKLFTLQWWKNRWKYGASELVDVANALTQRVFSVFGLTRESYFMRCLDKYLANRRPARFIFGSLDRVLCDEFRERFKSVPEGTTEPQCFSILPEGVHTLASLDAQDAAISLSTKWLKTQIRHSANESAVDAKSEVEGTSFAA